MSQPYKKSKSDTEIDDHIAGEIGAALDPMVIPVETKSRLKQSILGRIKKNADFTNLNYLTIRTNEGVWEEIAPGVSRKNLHSDAAAYRESFLVRIEPGCQIPGHKHNHDELCMVIEGEVSLGEIHLSSGDFHLARKGSAHGNVHSVTGAVLFIQAAA